MTNIPSEEAIQIERLPALPLRQLAVFPHMVLHFDVGRARSVAALDAAMMEGQRLFLTAQTDETVDDPTYRDLHQVGIVARIKQMLKLPNDIVRVLVEGLSRARLLAVLQEEPHLICDVALEPDKAPDPVSLEAANRTAVAAFEEYAHLSDRISSETAESIIDIEDPSQRADAMAANALTSFEDRQEILSELDVGERLFKLSVYLAKENDILRAEKRIHMRVKGQIEKNQREFYLREQIKAIHKELGERDAAGEVEEFREKAGKLALNDEAREKVEREIERLSRIAQNSPEYTVSRNYIEWLLEIPWDRQTTDNMDLKNAARILGEDHYGLDKLKERVLEYLAVRSLTGSMKGPILCFVGPPGVGKTSIARSIARALGREFARMSLGGMRDEAEIRGHRRTYIGAIPGRIITSMRQAGTCNPVLLFDEIDKLASDFRGDPASALLEVLDGEQNNTFRDHYLDVPYDLSRVMFLTTANSLDTIPRPLLDRMEVIEVSGYTQEEKVEIAKRHLIPKMLKEHGLTETPPVFADAALRALIQGYTRESGVRALEREIASLCRKAATRAAALRDKGKKARSTRITAASLPSLLGPARFRFESREEPAQVGVVTGLAYTAFGGDTLSIEVTPMPGTGQLTLTGQLGDVMQESAKAGLSYIRANAKALGVDEKFHKNIDLHIHVPAGATPKDGPSAGISMTSAMISALSKIPARQDVAMTGEITLRGRVLPIGGLKEKTLAAHRAGVKTVLFPQDNVKDINDIPSTVRTKLELVPVSSMEQVLERVLVRGDQP